MLTNQLGSVLCPPHPQRDHWISLAIHLANSYLTKDIVQNVIHSVFHSFFVRVNKRERKNVNIHCRILKGILLVKKKKGLPIQHLFFFLHHS